MKSRLLILPFLMFLFSSCNFFFLSSDSPLNPGDAQAPITDPYLDTSTSGVVRVQWRWGNTLGIYGINQVTVTYSPGTYTDLRLEGNSQTFTIPTTSGDPVPASEADFPLSTEVTDHWFFIHYRLNNGRWYDPIPLRYQQPQG